MQVVTLFKKYLPSFTLLFLVLFSTIKAKGQGAGWEEDWGCSQPSLNCDEEVIALVDRIMGVYNLQSRYLIRSCEQVASCLATLDANGRPWILYNPTFLNKVKGLSFTESDLPTSVEDWGALLVLAHEVGHHLNNHLGNSVQELSQKQMELEADETAGFVLYLLNAPDLETALSEYNRVSEKETYTHPKRSDRKDAFKKGWNIAQERYPRKGSNKSVFNKKDYHCGAFTAAGVWKRFLCYNLGAAITTGSDPFTPSWELTGGYWQWGQKALAAAGPSGPMPKQSGEGVVNGWSELPTEEDAWSDLDKTEEDPCPEGYRIPTAKEWEGVLANNSKKHIGTWDQSVFNYSSGIKLGDKLFLPAAGSRLNRDGSLNLRGDNGYYWSSTSSNKKVSNGEPSFASHLWFYASDATTTSSYRTVGLSVRCIAE